MSTNPHPEGPSGGSRLASAARVIVISSVMFTFISYWRTAAIVLSDLGSTAFYIGGIVEQAVGPAAPWFILAVMLFSYAVRSVYIESVSMFVRGGVYRVTREALGGMAAKVSVSALLFDYVLTGPISSVAAGQYVIGLMCELFSLATGQHIDPATRTALASVGSMLIAIAVTLYFFRQNLLGIHESSDKALKIMIATTIMAVVVLSWGVLTLAIDGPRNTVPALPDLSPKMNYALGHAQSPLGFLEGTSFGNTLASLHGGQFLSLAGLFGILLAFGHSILAMSGEETLAQVYREVESPKLSNFKKAAFVVFLYSLIFTVGISFLAVLLIPDDVRMARYADNLIGGLAMSVAGPIWLRLLLNGFVVVVGFLILSGAVNTAMIGANGVLNRVAEDGVVPAWLQKPHHRYGTTHRLLGLILALQITTILASRGDVIVLGEAYAFGVVWSFVFMTASMLVLRFKDRTPRPFRVPFNLRLGRVELPIGLGLIFLVLLVSAIINLLTKETATKWGLGFTTSFLAVFVISEQINVRRRRGLMHEHLEQFNRATVPDLSRRTRFDSAIPQTGRHPFAPELVDARKDAGRDRSGDHGRRGHDGETGRALGGSCGRSGRGARGSAVGDGRRQPRGDGRQIRHAVDRPNQQSPLRNPSRRQGTGRPGGGSRRLEQVHGRGPDGPGDVVLGEPLRGRGRALDGADRQPRARPVLRPGRRESHPENQRTQGPLRGRVACGGRGRRPRAVDLRRGVDQSRPVPSGFDHARLGSRARRWLRPTPQASRMRSSRK